MCGAGGVFIGFDSLAISRSGRLQDFARNAGCLLGAVGQHPEIRMEKRRKNLARQKLHFHRPGLALRTIQGRRFSWKPDRSVNGKRSVHGGLEHHSSAFERSLGERPEQGSPRKQRRRAGTGRMHETSRRKIQLGGYQRALSCSRQTESSSSKFLFQAL